MMKSAIAAVALAATLIVCGSPQNAERWPADARTLDVRYSVTPIMCAATSPTTEMCDRTGLCDEMVRLGHWTAPCVEIGAAACYLRESRVTGRVYETCVPGLRECLAIVRIAAVDPDSEFVTPCYALRRR